jgi:hypothetical protein
MEGVFSSSLDSIGLAYALLAVAKEKGSEVRQKSLWWRGLSPRPLALLASLPL